MNPTDWFLVIPEEDYHISTIQLDAKSRNILFAVVEDVFLLEPFLFFILKNGIA